MKLSNLTIRQLHQHYRDHDFSPEELIQYLQKRANELLHYNTWVYLMSIEEIKPYLENLKNHSPDDMPLYGIPFAIKDNIDLAGIPTTAGCEAFTYTPDRSAFVVQKLIDAGAIPLGKTNLDQFATGLVGTRSPYGATKNAFNPEYISGGSSSGSAVAVAQGLVSFSLGTDTAGSGRVPAAFNNIFGLKPSRGLLSNSGVVPACKTLDCVAVFATTASDLDVLIDISAQFDANDAYACQNPVTNTKKVPANTSFSFAVPRSSQLEYFGHDEYPQLFEQSISQLEKLGGHKHEIDFSAFIDAAKLLYEGPWVTERYLACQPLIDEQPEAFLDVTRSIIAPGKDNSAVDAFSSQYRLQAYKQQTDALLSSFDFLLTPTTGTHYTIDAVNNNPVQLNSNLGYYTNYMNLLDYASIAVPAGFTEGNLPFGVTLVSRKFTDRQLLAYAKLLHQSQDLKLGATNWPLPNAEDTVSANQNTIKLVVCGAHLSGLPLNHQLLDRHATLIKQCKSSPDYKLVALPGGPPERPGMIRVDQGGSSIEVELWQMPVEQLGSFLNGIPHPLGLGKVELDDGCWETGFICESYIDKKATDISQFGGWRAYLKSL